MVHLAAVRDAQWGWDKFVDPPELEGKGWNAKLFEFTNWPSDYRMRETLSDPVKKRLGYAYYNDPCINSTGCWGIFSSLFTTQRTHRKNLYQQSWAVQSFLRVREIDKKKICTPKKFQSIYGNFSATVELPSWMNSVRLELSNQISSLRNFNYLSLSAMCCAAVH